MKSGSLLLSLAMALGQSEPEWVLSPQLAPGLEFVYSGACVEEWLRPGGPPSRTYRIDNQLFVLSANDNKTWNVAFMTGVAVREPGDETRFGPPTVRLEVAQVDTQGRLKALAKHSQLRAPATALPLVESGCFVEAPTVRVGKNSFWEVAEEGRTPRSWLVHGVEGANGAHCVKLVGQQQSDDWDRPRADQTAWRRRDVVWLSLQLGVVVKLERTVERRDPAHREPTHRCVTQLTLESRLRYPGKLFENRQQEILQAHRFGEDAFAVLRQPGDGNAKIDAILRKIAYHLDNHPSTPYRKAVVHLAQRIDSARKGELLAADYREPAPKPLGPLVGGQKAPDFLATDWTNRTSLRLSRLLGRPVLIAYYNPHTEIGVDVLGFLKQTAEKHGDRVSIMAMAATTDADFARKQHGELNLPFPVLDGNTMRLAFQVEATPRFVVLDPEGRIAHSQTGWGVQTPSELRSLLERGLAPALAEAPAPEAPAPEAPPATP